MAGRERQSGHRNSFPVHPVTEQRARGRKGRQGAPFGEHPGTKYRADDKRATSMMMRRHKFNGFNRDLLRSAAVRAREPCPAAGGL